MPPPSPSPLFKGEFVRLDAESKQVLGKVVFQYNPATITRRLDANLDPRADYAGPPHHNVSFSAQFDDADLDPSSNSPTVAENVAGLELLLQPFTSQEAVALGILGEPLPPRRPVVVLALGEATVMPVVVTGLTVIADLFDPTLRPIRAEVEVSARVLSYSDVTGLERELALRYLEEVEKLGAGASSAKGGQVQKQRDAT